MSSVPNQGTKTRNQGTKTRSTRGRQRTVWRTAASVAAAGVLAVGAATTTAAHVTVSPKQVPADSYVVLTVGVPHGCEDSPTTSVAIQIPEGITAVTPTVNPGWNVRVVKEKLPEPLTDGHGNSITERTSEVVYRAKTPLPADLRDAFELSVKTPDTPGATLSFPALQKCEEGEIAWAQVPEPGVDAHDLQYPAPQVVLDEAQGHGNDAAAAASSVSSHDDPGASSATTWLAMGLGIVAVVVSVIALFTARRSQ